MDIYTFLLIVVFVISVAIFPRSITSKFENMLLGKKTTEAAPSEIIDIVKIKKSLNSLK